MGKLKHLALEDWPEADVEAFIKAYEPGDIFDESAGPGAHLAQGTRKMIKTAYRRWLGFLKEHHPEDLLETPEDRIILERVRAFVDHLDAETRPTSVAIAIDNLYYAARLIAPERDWRWLASIKRAPCRSRQAGGSLRPAGASCAYSRFRHRTDGRGAEPAGERP